MLKQKLDAKKDLQHLLFRRGFLISQAKFNMDQFPFYGNWNVEQLGGYNFMTHEDSKCHNFGL